ncbi:sugar ABC transporter permease [Paenibacillus sp. N3.4]|uniref:ABC transporter permease n=1 Tax=Paenibacillus sp. N3.4 TaxID=2603222 RepID=UPI0011C8D9EA|nr:sugar ABC transporter permease [Paenibacillus sp. N3.4]TXK75871.1 sugar ABC transporter permease [Paenibacillus sp. N3.4]
MEKTEGFIKPSTAEPILGKGTLTARIRSEWFKNRFLYLLALPGFIYFIVFKYVPMWGILISFQNFSPYLGFMKSEWVGFEHFHRLFTSPDFLLMLRNTFAINLISLIFFFPIPIVLSLMLNELKGEKFKRIIQSVLYLPHFLSWVIIVGISFLLLSQTEGIINKLLVAIGSEKIDFLTNPNYFWILLTAQSIWKEVGWGTIIFLAAIAAVDPQLYEAARMDGANRLRQAWHVTLPAIRNVTIVLLILKIGHIMEVGFEQVLLMDNGAVAKVSQVFDTYVYRVGVLQGEFSYSTAVGMFRSVVGLVLVVIANRLSKYFGEEGVY